jgi:hypothetical protein
MGKLLHTERYKLLHDKTFWIILAVVIIFNLIVTSGSIIFSLSGNKAFEEIMKKEILTILISCIYGGLFIGNDFAERTLYHGLMSGKSRTSVLFAKSVIFLIAIDIILFLFPFLLVVICTIKNGWGIVISESAILHLISIILALLILGFAIGMISILVAVCFRDVGRTIGIPVTLYFVMILLLNSSYTAALSRVFPAGTMILVINGTVSPAYSILVGAGWSATLFLASALIFQHAELG